MRRLCPGSVCLRQGALPLKPEGAAGGAAGDPAPEARAEFLRNAEDSSEAVYGSKGCCEES